MKTYFNYEGQINSKEAAEAIAFPIGIGPFMGFGSAEVGSNSVKIFPRSADTQATINPSPYFRDINDRGLARRISLRGDNTQPTFGLINRTGHVWVSTQPYISIDTIMGSQGSFNEVLVFAIFQDIQEPVINKPTFVAYWNGSAQSFYEYWRRSIDQNYGKVETVSESDPWKTSGISFEDLNRKVEAAVSWYENNSTAVLIGIYGTGTNVEDNNEESFALIPYHGVFPQSMPFTPDYYYSLKRQIKSLSNFVKEGLDGFLNVKSYIDSKFGDDNKEVPGTIPIGGIILWSGETIPDGWAICNGSQGTPDLQSKFVLAAGGDYKLGDTGGQGEYSLTIANIPAHKHQIYFQEYKWGDNSNRRPFPNNTQDPAIANGEDAGFNNIYTQNAGESTPTPVPTIPPYYVLYYIMRIR